MNPKNQTSCHVKIKAKIVFFSMLLFNCLITSALPTDSQAVLEMSAGYALFDQKKHHGFFKTDVAFDQGSTHIRATQITTEANEKNQLTQAIIFGEKHHQAHYWSTVSTDKPDLHAYADRIEYYPIQHLIKLLGHALIQQGKNSFAAAIITYNIETQQVITDNQSSKQRTVIVFHTDKDHSIPVNTAPISSTPEEKTNIPVQTNTSRIWP